MTESPAPARAHALPAAEPVAKHEHGQAMRLLLARAALPDAGPVGAS